MSARVFNLTLPVRVTLPLADGLTQEKMLRAMRARLSELLASDEQIMERLEVELVDATFASPAVSSVSQPSPDALARRPWPGADDRGLSAASPESNPGGQEQSAPAGATGTGLCGGSYGADSGPAGAPSQPSNSEVRS